MSAVRARAFAKINLGLAVGSLRDDGFHEIATILQRIDLADSLTLRPADRVSVTGFAGDTLVRAALERLAAASGYPGWSAELEKAVPLAAGLGGGSADAGTALALANASLPRPLAIPDLVELAASVGSDVPFFLEPGPKLAEGRGERLTPVRLPLDYWVLVVLPHGLAKRSTADVYRRFDLDSGAVGFEDRRARLVAVATAAPAAAELAGLPPNDLGQAAGDDGTAGRLRELGAFRAEVSGAGPAVYGLFRARETAVAAAATLPARSLRWLVRPVW